MDSSIFYASLIFGNGFQGIITTIKATNINTKLLYLVIFFIITIPILGAFIYLKSEKFSNKNPLSLKKNLFFIIFIFFILSSLICDFISKDYHLNYKKRLLLGYFFKPKKTIYKDKHLLSRNFKEEDIKKILKDKKYKKVINPNIFIFVIESFRKDFIKKDISPNLYKFKKENIYFKNSFSSSNCTHESWFSIFYGKHPVNWTFYKKNWKEGSFPLRILKSLDYKINLFSSSELKYFDMDKIIFGDKLQLANKYIEFTDKKPHIRDKKVFEEIKKNLTPDNNIFISFLESTHSEYSYPKNFTKFTPSSSINYLSLAFSKKNLNIVKNRYKNSIYYLDFLFKDFFNYLKKENLYENSIIVITADHAEEFFEEGSLFHGTHLNKYQLNIPIFYKLPQKTKKTASSSIDIFPTILEMITKKNFEFFDGHSIFSKTIHPIISYSQNSGKNPKKIAIYNKNISNNLIQKNL